MRLECYNNEHTNSNKNAFCFVIYVLYFQLKLLR